MFSNPKAIGPHKGTWGPVVSLHLTFLELITGFSEREAFPGTRLVSPKWAQSPRPLWARTQSSSGHLAQCHLPPVSSAAPPSGSLTPARTHAHNSLIIQNKQAHLRLWDALCSPKRC